MRMIAVSLSAPMIKGVKEGETAVREGTTLGELLTQAGIRNPDDMLMFVNQERAEPGRVLHDADQVRVYLLLSGG
jgi:sulfur carrier protein ThiS